MGELTTIDRDELQELRDENQRMFVALHEDCCKDFVNCNKGCEHLVKQLRADIASRQSCEVDAKRYRWLRECSCRSDRSCHVVWNHYDNGTFVSESQPSKDVLDQLIDEAMPSAKLGGGTDA